MADTILSIDTLIMTLSDWSREATGGDRDLVTVHLSVEHRAASLGDAQPLPPVELRDAQGGVYELESERGWNQPLQPGTSVDAELRFETPPDATDLDLVLIPAAEGEVVVRLA